MFRVGKKRTDCRIVEGKLLGKCQVGRMRRRG
jgi:hypothetical protein